MSKKKNKARSVVSTVIVVLVVALAVMLVGVKIVGLQPYAVLSGSMEPTYHVGALLYVKEVPAEEISEGDAITFVLDENLTVATHRVVGIDSADKHFITKGDANEFTDAAPVHFNNLIGKPVFSIPYLGYLANYIQHPPGKYLAIAAAAILLLLAFLPDLLDDDKKKKTQEEKNEK